MGQFSQELCLAQLKQRSANPATLTSLQYIRADDSVTPGGRDQDRGRRVQEIYSHPATPAGDEAGGPALARATGSTLLGAKRVAALCVFEPRCATRPPAGSTPPFKHRHKTLTADSWRHGRVRDEVCGARLPGCQGSSASATTSLRCPGRATGTQPFSVADALEATTLHGPLRKKAEALIFRVPCTPLL